MTWHTDDTDLNGFWRIFLWVGGGISQKVAVLQSVAHAMTGTRIPIATGKAISLLGL
ncbi:MULTISPECIES: hypothetical protein [unclassified Flavobacterium]|uniref:hypothetical protein n=1 Tax=unclassified Flavobacterium TaxID=196869 RepID=UPI0025BFE210|nr:MULTISPECIES: hypothetical protein [unclassified Flavobacterium]